MRTSLFEDSRLMSRAIPVHWAGWRSDTFELQRNGWEIAVSRSHGYADRMHFAFRHSAMNLYGVSLDWELAHHPMAITDPRFNEQLAPIVVSSVAPKIEVIRVQGYSDFDLVQVDAQPRIVESEITSLEDMNIFSVCQHRTKEVLVEQADMSVVDHLEMVLKQQSERQAELREKARRSLRQGEEIGERVEGDMMMQIVRVA